MAATRFQIYLQQNQYQELRRLSRDLDTPIAALIRNAIDEFLSQRKRPPEDDPIWSVVGLIDTPFGRDDQDTQDE